MKRALVIAIWTGLAFIVYLLFTVRRDQGHSGWDTFWDLLFCPFGALVVALVMRPVLDYIRQVKPPSLERGESLVHSCWVTYPLGWDLVGGALYVTTRRIQFCPSRVNFHKWNFAIPLNQVSAANVFKPRFEICYRLVITDSRDIQTEFAIGRHEKSLAEKILRAR